MAQLWVWSCAVLLTWAHLLLRGFSEVELQVVGYYNDAGRSKGVGEVRRDGGFWSERNVLRIELMSRDHKDSPFRGLGVETLEGRLKAAVERSANRVIALEWTMGHTHVFPSDYRATVLTGNGEYTMVLELGTPSQKFSAIVDTGSDLTWIQCAPCSSCYHQPDAFFDPAKSSSYKALSCSNNLCQALPVVETCSPSCQYFYEYGDQSTTVGTFSSETVSLASLNGGVQQIPSVAFGCGHSNQGTFSQVDGLVGLGQGPISFTSQLSTLFQSKFAYCFVSVYDSPYQTSSLLFGSAATPSGNVQYTPIVRNSVHPTYYYIGLQGISIGGKYLDIPPSAFAIDSSGGGGTIIDSGTTVTQLVESAYTAVVQAFVNGMPYPQVSKSATGLDLCFDVSRGSSTISVPTLTFHFTDADISLPGDNYFVAIDTSGTLCLAMASSSGFSIFGNIQQQNYQIVYDRSAGRIGFKEIQCDTVG